MGWSTFPGVALFVVLVSCGDASQIDDDGSDHRSSAESFSQAERTPVRPAQPLDFTPLSSQALLQQAIKHAPVPDARALLMSSGMGVLPELITSAAEDLGLTVEPETLSLTSETFLLPEGLRWQATSTAELRLSPQDEPVHRSVMTEMKLTLDGIPVHNAHIKMLNDNGNPTWMSGTVPHWMSEAFRPQTTPFSMDENTIRQTLESQLGFRAWRFKLIIPAYLAEKNTARAIYLVTVTAEHRANDFGPSVPVEAAVDADTGQLLWQRPLALHVDGDARVYRENKAVASQMQSVPMPELQISDSLIHPLFNVYNCQKKPRHLDTQGTYCRALATGSQNSFNFEYDSSQYDEVVSYAAITSAMEKFRTWDAQSLRSDWDQSKWPGARNNFGLIPKSGQGSSSKQLSVYVNTETKSATTNRCNSDTTPDNAQYLWAGIDGGGQPEILIGYGGYGSPCGSLLELGKDFDVVMHEFGHHAVFRGLSNTTSQAIALHEGYSDYLTYAVSGNNLLAENSFPGRRALREGNITSGTTYFRFKRKSDGSYYTVKDYLSYPHLVGEFWSGILWEMRSELGRATDGSYKMDKIVWDSIDLLKSDGGLVDGVMAISESAKRYGERFGDDAQGLQAAVHKIFVKYEFASLGGSGELIPTDALASVATGTTKSKKVRWGCGVIAQNHHRAGTDSPLGALVVFALLLAPLGVGGAARLRRVATQLAVVRRKPKSYKN